MTWLVLLYPPAWRDRYGVEMSSLLAEEPIRPHIVWDVLSGAVDAWVTGPWGIVISTHQRLRMVAGVATLTILVGTRNAFGPSPEARALAVIGVALIAIAQTIVMRSSCEPVQSS